MSMLSKDEVFKCHHKRTTNCHYHYSKGYLVLWQAPQQIAHIVQTLRYVRLSPVLPSAPRSGTLSLATRTPRKMPFVWKALHGIRSLIRLLELQVVGLSTSKNILARHADILLPKFDNVSQPAQFQHFTSAAARSTFAKATYPEMFVIPIDL